ncbi:MAG: ATP-binding protein [Lentimicrobiaceae bacterium]
MNFTDDEGLITNSTDNGITPDSTNKMYVATFQKSPLPLFIIDANLQIIDCNQKVKSNFYLPDGFNRKNLSDYFHTPEVDDASSWLKLLESKKTINAFFGPDDSTVVILTFTILTKDFFLVEAVKKLKSRDHFQSLIEEAKSQGSDFFQTIINTTLYPFCIIDVKNNSFIIRNKAHNELFESLVSASISEQSTTLERNEVPDSLFFENIKAAKQPFVEVHEYLTIQGQKLHYVIHGFPVFYPDKNEHFVILHYNNVTDEIQYKQQAEEYRKTIADLFSNLPGMIFRCLNETNWTIEYASPGCKALTGYTAEALINNNKIKYGDLIHPEDKKIVWNTIQEAIKRKQCYTVEYRILTKKGNLKWVTERGKGTYDKFGQLVSIDGFISDISEGKYAEINLTKELRISEAVGNIGMELLKDSVTPVDVSRLVQKHLKEITGSNVSIIYSPDETGNGFTLFDHSNEEETITIVPEAYSDEQLKFIKHLINLSEPFIQNTPETIILPGLWDTPTEVNRYISIPAFTKNKLSGLLIMGKADNDYTDETITIGKRLVNMFALGLYRLKAEETLQDAKNRAVESDRLKSLFLSNMSHEIRTPMNAIVGFAEMLQETDLDREQKNRFLDVIIKSGDNLLRLINDIIDISKIEAGQLTFDYSDCLVNEMIADLETYFKQELTRVKKPHLSLYIQMGHPESDFAIYTDPMRLKQILNNLIGNAIKFTDEGFIEFGYQIKAGAIEFYVRDSGIGIALDQQEVIFERFGQVREAVSRNQSGTGLGLTISKNLVEMLGGTMWVDSYPGEGSTFYFSLPLHLSSRQVIRTNKKDIDIPRQLLNLKGKTILIVEDVDTNYFYLSSLLQKMDCIILRATNGMKAIEMCRKDDSIDLVLMDIELPILDGYKATREIKKFKPDLPIIAQTAFAMTGERERSKEAGCDDYLSKPIRKEELLETLSKFL